jgi:hypothetical protein
MRLNVLFNEAVETIVYVRALVPIVFNNEEKI